MNTKAEYCLTGERLQNASIQSDLSEVIPRTQISSLQVQQVLRKIFMAGRVGNPR